MTAKDAIARAGARNGYDAARAVESYLRDNYGYTLDLKAGGPDPLADFLFNVKEGHCEYFSTAMAVMLRTQGLPRGSSMAFCPGNSTPRPMRSPCARATRIPGSKFTFPKRIPG